jgi:hypothetical protein
MASDAAEFVKILRARGPDDCCKERECDHEHAHHEHAEGEASVKAPVGAARHDRAVRVEVTGDITPDVVKRVFEDPAIASLRPTRGASSTETVLPAAEPALQAAALARRLFRTCERFVETYKELDALSSDLLRRAALLREDDGHLDAQTHSLAAEYATQTESFTAGFQRLAKELQTVKAETLELPQEAGEVLSLCGCVSRVTELEAERFAHAATQQHLRFQSSILGSPEAEAQLSECVEEFRRLSVELQQVQNDLREEVSDAMLSLSVDF